MTPDQSFAAAVVAIYAVVTLPTLFVTFKHGVRGLAVIGWVYLFLFCTLKMVGSGLQLGSGPNDSGASIVSSVGLSPLLLAAGGVLHEA